MEQEDSAAQEDIAAGRRAIRAEADALGLLGDRLGPSFAGAVERLAATRGHIVLSGIGKSGHIARKVAATFSSVGAPSLFVHATEAAHGDLGVFTPRDLALLLSNSGETSELAGIIDHCRREGNPVLSITGVADSSLARLSDVALVLPQAMEACPLGLAPMTSTTMMLALGDALAVALMARRDFSARRFGRFHPGGRLGRRLRRTGDIMRSGNAMATIGADAPTGEAILEISGKGMGCVAVTEADGILAGIVTDGDLRRHMAPDLLSRKVREIMTRTPQLLDRDTLVGEAIRIMNERRITAVCVVDAAGRLCGMLHMHDCLREGAG